MTNFILSLCQNYGGEFVKFNEYFSIRFFFIRFVYSAQKWVFLLIKIFRANSWKFAIDKENGKLFSLFKQLMSVGWYLYLRLTSITRQRKKYNFYPCCLTLRDTTVHSVRVFDKVFKPKTYDDFLHISPGNEQAPSFYLEPCFYLHTHVKLSHGDSEKWVRITVLWWPINWLRLWVIRNQVTEVNGLSKLINQGTEFSKRNIFNSVFQLVSFCLCFIQSGRWFNGLKLSSLNMMTSINADNC